MKYMIYSIGDGSRKRALLVFEKEDGTPFFKFDTREEAQSKIRGELAKSYEIVECDDDNSLSIKVGWEKVKRGEEKWQ